MQFKHAPAAVSAVFDDPNLVSAAGLVSMLRLAQQSGLAELAQSRLSVPTDKGANAGGKVMALVAGMLAGADSIDDMNLLRHGGMGRLFDRTYAPSTLGSFLREFTFGHVRQLDALASRTLVNLSSTAPLLQVRDDERVMVDLDDTIIDVSEGNEMRNMATMRRGLGGSVLLSALLATSFITGPAASATTGEDAPVTGVMTVSCSGEWGYGGYQFGHYIGAIHVPSATQVTDAGLEAQCLLQAWHETLPEEISDPGAVDGIFGPLSQAAMADVQQWANENRGGDLDGGDLLVDGFPGPQSWPQLRNPLLPHP